MKICNICGREAKRKIDKLGHRYGFQKTCGSAECQYQVKVLAAMKRMGLKPWNLGQKTSVEIKAKQSKAQQLRVAEGRNHLYIDGRTMRAKYRLDTAEYKEFRTSMFRRDGFTCQCCGKRGGCLHLDHILPRKLFPTLLMVDWNVRTLCRDCHTQTATYGLKFKQYREEFPRIWNELLENVNDVK